MKTEKKVAMILAGGIGARMNSPVPKQFHIINDKPVIVYAIEAFQNSTAIDDIVIVLLEEWHDIMVKYIEKYNLYKVVKIVPGGSTGFQSIQKGTKYLHDNYQPEDIILIHDAVRPLVTEEIINGNIAGVEKHGNAVTVIPTTEALLYSEDGKVSEKIVNRDYIMRTQTPQSLRLGDLVELHEKAREAGIEDSVATCTLLIEMGHKVHMVTGDNSNFKLTAPEDVALFSAYLDAKK